MAAHAQSSVTLYGVVDLGITKVTGQDAEMSGNGIMNNGNSRLGVRGTEDLGNGLKLNFNLEQGINAETGATDTNTFQRAANVALSGEFGSFKMGRTLTPSFYGLAAWELTGMANYSAVANQFGVAGAGSRNNSEFSYTTPNFNGFSATLGRVTERDAGGAAKTDFNAIYTGGPMAVGLSYNKVQGLDRNVALGAKYDFGAFQLAGSLQDPAGAKRGFTIGAGTTVGPIGLVLDIARDTGSAVKSTDVLLETKYSLSKRSMVYAAALRDGSAKATGIGIGLRHNF